jgi:hypothetical protein
MCGYIFIDLLSENELKRNSHTNRVLFGEEGSDV